MKVEDLPVDELGRAIADWVQSYFNDKRCALLPAYALDTAMFIEKHVSGHYQADPEWWEIEPMMDVGNRDVFRFIDTRFKSNFTSRFVGTLVRCRLPEGCAIKFQKRALVSGTQEFCAAIKRCHLSSNFQDAIYLHTEIPDRPAFRLDLGFWFVGEILVTGQGSLNQWRSDPESYPIRPVLLPEEECPLHSFRSFDMQFPASWGHFCWPL